jgi:hypothetical protein
VSLTLEQLNAASLDEAAVMLDGLYEHSPWIVRAALAQRPFASLATLKHACAQVVAQATRDQQLGLIRAHPELAGKAILRMKARWVKYYTDRGETPYDYDYIPPEPEEEEEWTESSSDDESAEYFSE